MGKKLGGLGIGGIKEANLALLSKWWWRWRNNRDTLWARVIEGIHGRGFGRGIIPIQKNYNGVWKDISTISKDFLNYNFDINSRIGCRIGNGRSISFWKDRWATVNPFCISFPAAYDRSKNRKVTLHEMYTEAANGSATWNWAFKKSRLQRSGTQEDRDREELEEILRSVKLNRLEDYWGWETGSTLEDSVKTVREELDKQRAGISDTGSNNFGWCGWAPAKANVLLWRIKQGRIATKDQLLKRGISSSDQMCATCKEEAETVPHLMWNCTLSVSIWKAIATWLGVPQWAGCNTMKEFCKKVGETGFRNKNQKKGAKVVVLATFWKIWENRNDQMFRNFKSKEAKRLIGEIKDLALFWLKCRANVLIEGIEEWEREGIRCWV